MFDADYLQLGGNTNFAVDAPEDVYASVPQRVGIEVGW
jgi:hypothetical protein